jgi:hypothetical protein
MRGFYAPPVRGTEEYAFPVVNEPAHPAIPGWLALCALAPAVVFLTVVTLKYGLGYPFLFDSLEPLILHPVAEAIVVFSPVVALALGALPIVHVRIRRVDGTLRSTITLRLSITHILAAALGAAISAVFAAYFVAENLL